MGNLICRKKPFGCGTDVSPVIPRRDAGAQKSLIECHLEQIDDICNGKCMDNRVASWVAINALRRISASGSSRYDIYYAATVQEEVGCRGAGPTSFGIDPDVGIAIDTTLACDVPGIDKTD